MELRDPWQSIDTAPRDGTMLLLLLDDDKPREHALEDTTEPTTTIGFNSLSHTGNDIWDLAGWDWSQDCFRAGKGIPVAWAPIPAWLP